MDDNSAPVWGRNLPGELQDKWPKNDGGDYEAPAFLTRRSAVDMDDELLVNMLEAYGIPCFRQYPNNGRLGRVILGMAGGGVDIFVPAPMLEAAKELCEGASDDENL